MEGTFSPAQHLSGSTTSTDVLTVIERGLALGDADVAVHLADGRKGMVLIHRGLIAWVFGGGTASYGPWLKRLTGVQPSGALLHRIRDHAGTTLIDTLAGPERDVDDAYAACLAHNRDQLTLLRHAAVLSAQVTPVRRRYNSDLLFPLDLLIRQPVANDDTHRVHADDHIADAIRGTAKETVAALMTIEGAVAAGLGDWRQGTAVASAGSPNGAIDGGHETVSAARTLRQVQAMLPALGDEAMPEDVVVSTSTHHFVCRALPLVESHLFVCVILERENCMLGLARFRLEQLANDLVHHGITGEDIVLMHPTVSTPH